MVELHFILFIASVILSVIWFWIKYNYSIWDRCRIPFEPALFPFGNVRGMGKTKHIYEIATEYYEQYKLKSKLVGLHIIIAPAVIVTDLDLIKEICIKDFNVFINRGIYTNARDDPLSANLFNLEGEPWRVLRAKVSSTFSSGKMKMIFGTICELAHNLVSHLDKRFDGTNTDITLEIHDLLARYTTDVIGTVAFGLDCNSLDAGSEAKFLEMGRLYFSEGRNRGLKHFLRSKFQNVARFLRVCETPKPVTEFFMSVVKKTIEYREQENIKKNDVMDLLIQLKNYGKFDDEPSETIGFLTFNEIVAHAFVFFAAGFETTSTTMAFCLYELARNPDIQNRARSHITEIMKKYNGKLNYNSLGDLKYLEQVINETLRKYPPAPLTLRQANSDYIVSSSATKPSSMIPKDVQVIIPVYSIHHDKRIYPNPERFDPCRFSEEAIKRRHPNAFMPFGDGPRVCIAVRFAMMEMKLTLANLLQRYEFTVSDKTVEPLQISKYKSVLSVDNGIWLNLKRITTNQKD